MSKFQIVVIRHGPKDESVPARSAGLGTRGQLEAHDLAQRLKRLGVELEQCFTSSRLYALQTAEILADEAGSPGLKPSKLSYLTPPNRPQEPSTTGPRYYIPKNWASFRTPEPAKEGSTPGTEQEPFPIDCIIEQNAYEEIGPNRVGTVAVVGHQPQLNNLVSQMTSKRLRPLGPLEAICLEGTIEDFRCGRAEVKWRVPVKVYQEAELRAKITSKLTVATLLAGFIFAALVQLTTAASPPIGPLCPEQSTTEVFIKALCPEQSTGQSSEQNTPTDQMSEQETTKVFIKALYGWLAVISFAAAGALFIATAYIYDRLNMPEGFWTASRSTGPEKPPIFVRNKEAYVRTKDEYGPVYAHMVHAWTHVFTPGVALGTFGFLLLVIRADSILLGVFCAIVLIASVWYYRKVRPELGVD